MTRQRKQKINFWERDKRCYWCGRETILTNEPHMEAANPLMATIDHLFSRHTLQRYVSNSKNERRHVLACYECNHRRNNEEMKKIPLKELHARGNGLSSSLNSTCDSLDEVIVKLKEKGVDILKFRDSVTTI